MRIGFIIYHEMTALDFVGVYDPLIRLKTMGFMPGLRWDICAFSSEVADSVGLGFIPTRVGTPLQEYDMIIDTVEVVKDHVHIFLEAPPRLSPSRIVQMLKSISAREIFR